MHHTTPSPIIITIHRHHATHAHPHIHHPLPAHHKLHGSSVTQHGGSGGPGGGGELKTLGVCVQGPSGGEGISTYRR
ncbi:hypothetical protein EON63_23150 [archaeon]|nr:MAG: hypothetical protein EON63_23150 [archaeon]